MARRKKPGASEGESYSVILDSIADGVFTINMDWRITSFNRSAEQITGVSREEAIGKPCHDIFHASICETACALRKTMETGRPVVNRSIFIVTPDGRRVPVSISTALLRNEEGETIGGVETFRDLSELEELRKELYRQHSFGDIISKNRRMQGILAILPDVAESDSTVLIQGPSGSGKELVARAMHGLSRRAAQPFVVIDCGALPDALLESELFGYKAGAFTDARRDKVGRLAVANGGTLLLDEIGDVSPALQVRLLRVLQEKEFVPLGATSPQRIDVRIITATNKDIEEMVRRGEFRQDFYYRINVARVRLPALAERREDIPLLVDHFIRRFNGLRGKEIAGMSEDAMDILMRHDFPGNVRELENILEHAFILCHGSHILPEHLPDSLYKGRLASALGAGEQTLEGVEARHIYEALECNHWKRAATAKELGIHRTTLARRMKRLGLKPPR